MLYGIMSLLFITNACADGGGNSVYIDQTNADQSSLSITQTGSGNQVGDRTDLITPAFAIEGNNMDLTIIQDGMNNTVVGNFIGGDSLGSITQTGSNNIFKLNQGNFGTNSGKLDATFTGDSNQAEINMGTTASTNNYDYKLSVTGNLNNITSTLNSKYIVNDITIAGNSNALTTVQNGVNGTSATPGHKITTTVIGDNNILSITQNGTTTPNIVTLNVTGTGTNTTIIQH